MPKGHSYIQPAQKTDWETPEALFEELWEEDGGYDLDPCCTPDQYTAQRVMKNGGTIYLPPDIDYKEVNPELAQAILDRRVGSDGLAQPWHGKVFMNPPYGLALRKWVPKAVHEVECGNVELVRALLPSKTDTQWWQEYVLTLVTEEGYECATWPPKPAEIRFIKGRLTFQGAPAPAGHASAIVVWRR